MINKSDRKIAEDCLLNAYSGSAQDLARLSVMAGKLVGSVPPDQASDKHLITLTLRDFMILGAAASAVMCFGAQRDEENGKTKSK